MNKTALLLTVLLFSIHTYSQISWEQLSGPYGGEVTSLGGNPEDYLFAVLRDDILFRSNDGGQTWEKVLNDPADGFNSEIVLGLDHKLYARHVSSFQVSEDNGNSWIEVNPLVEGLHDFIVLPSGIIIGAGADSFIRSTDGGLNWETVYPDLGNWIDEFRYDPYTGWVYAFTDYQDRIYLSTDNGINWSILFEEDVERIHDVAGDPMGGIWILVDNKILYSIDNGSNFD